MSHNRSNEKHEKHVMTESMLGDSILVAGEDMKEVAAFVHAVLWILSGVSHLLVALKSEVTGDLETIALYAGILPFVIAFVAFVIGVLLPLLKSDAPEDPFWCAIVLGLVNLNLVVSAATLSASVGSDRLWFALAGSLFTSIAVSMAHVYQNEATEKKKKKKNKESVLRDTS